MTENLRAQLERALAVEWEDGVGATCALNVLWPLIEQALASARPQWQPIATAERDAAGPWLLLLCPRFTHAIVGRWFAWTGHNEANGFWQSSVMEVQPTHWMRLPPAPASVPDQSRS